MLFAIDRKHLLLKVHASNPSVQLAVINRLNLVYKAVENFVKVKNSEIHPKYFSQKLKFKSEAEQMEEVLSNTKMTHTNTKSTVIV